MEKIFLTVILAGAGVQGVKMLLILLKHRRLTWQDLIVTGGMPSSHSAFVTSLSTIIYLYEGLSTSFSISVVLALIVLRDAFGVRRTVGEEGLVINKLMKKMNVKTKTHFAMGHTKAQVFVGSILGILIALGVFYFF